MMSTYHVHVYKIVAMQEFDIEADNAEKATSKALAQADEAGWEPADCQKVAILPTRGEGS